MNRVELIRMNNHHNGCPCYYCPVPAERLSVGDKILALVIQNGIERIIESEILNIHPPYVRIKLEDASEWNIATQKSGVMNNNGMVLDKLS